MHHHVLDYIGHTPCVLLNSDEIPNMDLFCKLEYYNPCGSIKDRAAWYVITRLINEGKINKDSLIIESSSGNFGIALSFYCKKYGIPFCCVIDKNICEINEFLIRRICDMVYMIDELDQNGGYLLNRINKVHELLEQHQNSFWINQYMNPIICEAYYHHLGDEIVNDIPHLDYAFIGVSSGGTISGLSRRLKKEYPQIRIIAVDVKGSVIFGGSPEKRSIPGIGSSVIPENLKSAIIDDIVIVSEQETIESCYRLLEQHMLFVGGSSGSVFAATKKYFQKREITTLSKALLILPDRGDKYFGIVYKNDGKE